MPEIQTSRHYQPGHSSSSGHSGNLDTPAHFRLSMLARHVSRLKMGLSGTRASISEFITRYTFLHGKRFSYRDHEFQPYIINEIENDPDLVLLLYKCSQLGVSEIFYRIILAMMSIEAGFATLLGMPSQTFSQEVMKTRIAQIIRSAPVLRELLDQKVDSASVKQFLNGSILYALGAGYQSGQSSLINRPIKLVCIDELDRCSMDIITGFRSRQTHSIHKPRIYISTPTYEDLGIDGEADGAEIRRNIVKCCHCGHYFFPDYYQDIFLPGYDQPLELLTRSEAEMHPAIRIDEARLLCPKCKKTPDLSPEWRKFVVETPQKSTIERKICIKLAPFDAPAYISVPTLIRSSFVYSDNNEFRNQGLGLPVKAADSSIHTGNLRFERVDVPQDSLTVFGLDMGKLCHRVLLSLTPQGQIIIHTPEVIPLSSVEQETTNLLAGVATVPRIGAGVVDSLPYTDTVNRVVSRHPQVWSAVYYVPVQPKPELYWLKVDSPGEAEEARRRDRLLAAAGGTGLDEYAVRQVTLNKNPFFDYAAGLLQSGQVIFQSGPYDAQIISHISDMRRVRDHRFADLRYKWVKSRKGNDHFFHSIIYGITALKLIDTIGESVLLPKVLLNTIRLKSDL